MSPFYLVLMDSLKFGEICTCEDRLHDYPVNCTIADKPYFTKAAVLDFWMGVSYVNTTYQGLVLCKSCPAEYCKKGAVNVTIDNPDMQCDLNRTGLLCGACAANHSLHAWQFPNVKSVLTPT